MFTEDKIQTEKNLKVKMVVEDERYKPIYANDTDACMDLRVKIDENNERVAFIMPKETKVFGTGVKVSVPLEHVMLIFPRSSTGIKLHCMLSNTTGVIDSGYRDEIRMAVTNFGNETVCLQDGQRVAQFMIIPRPKIELKFVDDNEEFRQGNRGGGIGSSNRKLGK